MNLNTIDPLLYRNRTTGAESKIQKYNSEFEKNPVVDSDDKGFFNKISSAINESIDSDVRQQISSSNLNFNMTKNVIMADVKNSPDKEKLYNASKEFESFFVEKMFIEMKKNIPKNELFHGGYAEEIFDDMLLSERVRKVSDQSEFGLAEMMYQQLSVVYS
jgi:flagellar protein FlgJ